MPTTRMMANQSGSVHPMDLQRCIGELEGPIFVVGAGGFIGINLFNRIFAHRRDVYAVTKDAQQNWRMNVNRVPRKNIVSCDINEVTLLKHVIDEYRPRTILNLAAYGAYSKQREYGKIHLTNFNSTINFIEALKETGFSAYVHAGSSSEYGTNASAPTEDSPLHPNSHYAVSKVACFHAIRYYGVVEGLPVAHLRLYSAYGPWEEPDRLVPVLVSKARGKAYPRFVQREVSRDFVHVSDVCNAFLLAAGNISRVRGDVFNIGSGIKTTIGELAELVAREFGIQEDPVFSGLPNRDWDILDWYSDSSKARDVLGWKAEIELGHGLVQVGEWQREVDYDNAYWNFNR